MKTSNLDAMRESALRRVERADLFLRMALVGATVVEAIGIGGMLLIIDFKDPLHRLILMQSVLVYGTLAIGLLALGAMVRGGTLRILAALELGAGDGAGHSA